MFIQEADEYKNKAEFVEYYNHKRYHESLKNLMPSGVYYGRGELILQERKRIKMEN